MQFDSQAETYDNRTGLGEATAKKIASALQEMIEPDRDNFFLEIGAGTGEIGYYLQDLPIRYVGMDLSSGMLEIYRKRFGCYDNLPTLLQTDGNNPWPFENDSVSVFFSSRAMHQLERSNVLEQLNRLSVPGSAILILGNIKRNKHSVKAMMRQEMHKILNEYGIVEKSGQSNRKMLFEALEAMGGQRLEPVVAARWKVSNAAIESINSWKSVEGIAGQNIDKALKDNILDKLVNRANQQFTDLNKPIETEEIYELNAIKLPCK